MTTCESRVALDVVAHTTVYRLINHSHSHNPTHHHPAHASPDYHDDDYIHLHHPVPMSTKPLRWLRRDEPTVDWALVHQLVNTGVEPDAAISIIERAQNDVGLLAELIAHERHSVAAAPSSEESNGKPKDGFRAKAAAALRPRAWSGASNSSRPSLESAPAATSPSPVPVIRVDDCRICTEEELAERAEGLRAH